MSGQHGARGYLLQAIVCVLDGLDDQQWTSVTIEPDDESEKVDIVWAYGDSRQRKVQVKHSTKPIGVADAKRWAKELEEPTSATEYELRLLGNCKEGLPPADGMFGRVAVPLPEVVNLNALRKQAAHSLDVYLSGRTNPQSLRPRVREMVVEALSHRVGAMSTEGAPLTRSDLDGLLNSWINEILLQAGCATTSTHSDQQRFELLQQQLNYCRGRQIAGWQAAGIPRELAIQLVSDGAWGSLPGELLPNDDSPLRLLIAPLGTGKTLAVNRYFESLVREATCDRSSPVPVFLEAPLVNGGLEQAVRDACDGIGTPEGNSIRFVVDRLDELSARDAQRMLGEARTLVHAWRGAHAILTSRPLLCWQGVEEVEVLQPLDEGAALRLVAIASASDQEEIDRAAWNWAASIKETIRTPLFAILFGRYRQRGQETLRVSRAGLIAHLVEAAMNSEAVVSESVQAACRDLAIQCLDRGGTVPSTEIQPRSVHDAMMRTGLVVESNGSLSFALPILMQWFGGGAIKTNKIEVKSLWNAPGRIDRWRAAIAVAVGTGTEDLAERILRHIAERDPGFLHTIVEEATSHWSLDVGVQTPNPKDAAVRIRSAMKACKTGIGILAAVITPIDPRKGSLLPTGTRCEGEWVIAGWSADASHGEILSLPPHITVPGPWMAGDKMLPGAEEMLSFTLGSVAPCWLFVRGARPGQQPAWAWRWVADQLRDVLKHRLKPVSMFDHCAQPLVSEAAWETALDLLHYGRDHTEPIPTQAIEDALPMSIDELAARSQAMQQTTIAGNWREIDATMLGAELGRLRELGIHDLTVPLPTADLTPEGPARQFPWLRYSETQFLHRLSILFQLALESYSAIVKEWFQPFEPRLHRAVTLPARIVMVVDMKGRQPGIESEPWVQTHWEPLPPGYESEVVVKPGEVRFATLDHDAGLRLMEELIRLRPASSESIGIIRSAQATFDFFSEFAIRKLTFQWLEDDLQRINWLVGH